MVVRAMRPHIVFACTNYGPLWAPAVESWLRCVIKTARQYAVEYPLGQLALEPGRGGLVATGISDRCYTAASENKQIQGFLALPEATHLFWCESDMCLPDDAILKLLEVDKDIVSGVYYLRDGWGAPCLYKQVVKMRRERADQVQYGHTPVTVFPQTVPFKLGDKRSSGVPGFGCVLIKRQVLEAMTPPWCQQRDGAGGYGSDMYFYKHACEAGFEVWVQPAVQCGQIDYTVFTVEDYHDRLQQDPDFARSGYIIGLPEGTP
jgi:hypothetical protein